MVSTSVFQVQKDQAQAFNTMSKKTVIVGATPNPERYAYLAADRLSSNDHEIVPLGIKKGQVFGKEILPLADKPKIGNVDTITLYINPTHQKEWQEYLLSLNPNRIIFNPGTENPEFAELAKKQGIEPVFGCTLVMLSARTF